MARKAKEKQYERKRRKCTFTLSDQAREFLKKNVTNASRFIERLLEDAEKGIKGAYVTVSPIGESRWGGSNPRPADYESAASNKFDLESERKNGEKLDRNKPIVFEFVKDGKTVKMTSKARKLSEGRYYFDLESILYYAEVVKKDLRPRTRAGTRTAIYQLLYNGEKVVKAGGRFDGDPVTKLSAEIDYNAVLRFNDYANTVGANTTLTYGKAFLKHFGAMWDDSTLKSWSESLTYRAKKKKRAFATTGSKAAIEEKDILEDIRRYYDAIIAPPQTVQEHQGKAGFYRNLVTLLFGITTGIRSEEQNRVEWSDIEDAEKDYEITFEDGAKAIKPKHAFILTADKTKTNIDRIIPIHPDIEPYLKLLKEVYPRKPFDTPNYLNKRKEVSGTLQVRQFRNFASKYFNDYGFDEYRRIAIMGHDEGKLSEEAKRIADTKGVSALYRVYGTQEIVAHYRETLGRNFSPIPDFVDLDKIRYQLTTSYKEQKK